MSNHAHAVRTSATKSAAQEEWGTPHLFFQEFAAMYGPYTFDLAASSRNAKCVRFFSREDNALGRDWKPGISIAGEPGPVNARTFWLNPPYGKVLPDWIAKARQSAIDHPIRVSLLIPARTDTKYWHELIWLPFGVCRGVTYGSNKLGVLLQLDTDKLGLEVLFLRGRVPFLEIDGTEVDPAPFPSALVTFTNPGWRHE